MKKFLGIVFLCLLLAQAACASSATFDNGVAMYNSARYQEAIVLFQQELRSNPNDGMSHYYTAASWHCLGRLLEAAQEYAWILNNSTDPDLQRRAQFGLHALARAGIKVTGRTISAALPGTNGQIFSVVATVPAQSGQTYAQASGTTGNGQFVPYSNAQALSPLPVEQNDAAPVPSPPAPIAPVAGSNAAPIVSPALPNVAQPQAGIPKVIDLYTDWCGWCHRFEPLFDQARAKYGNQISFQKENGEAHETRRVVKKYRVHSYPTILFFNENGKLVKRVNGAPQSMEEFENDIFSAFPALRAQPH